MLDWLKSILPEHLHFNLSLLSPKITVIKVEAKEDNINPVIVDGDKLIINDSTEEGAEIAEQAIKGLPEQLKHNDAAIEEEGLDNLSEIDDDISGSSYEKDLNIFRGTVPKKDIPILEVAILIAIRYKKNRNITKQKAQVVARYGARGAMICNLYSSGYFKSLILPLHKSITEGNLAMDEYLSIYEMIVTESPLAMFVGVGSSKEKIKAQLIEKIEYNQENNVGYLNIHGIGKTNIRVIRSLVTDEEITKYFIEDPVLSQVDTSIKATIFIDDTSRTTAPGL